MRLAVVHDYLCQFGGAERVISALNEVYPQAPIYTSIFDETKMPVNFQRMEINTSFMQKIPLVFPLFKALFWLYPLAFERFDLSGYEVILSSSSAYAKGVKKRPGQLHLCYCYTPMRFVWRYDDYVKREAFPAWLKQVLPFFLEPIKNWDLKNSAEVDGFIAISKTVADRIKQTYGRDSVIIYPPVETDFFRPSKVDGDYYLIVSRLNAYKRIDLAVKAFNQLDLPLKIIGDGPDRKTLARQAGPNIEFLGRLSDIKTAKYLSECRALVFTGEEDFGIVPLEAMACGRPVIAYNGGGAQETIVSGETGLFFEQQTVQSLVAAVEAFKFKVFDKEKIREHAKRFDKKVFQRKISEYIKGKYEERSGK
ncbi:MAG: glycosyltransferase [bacterium]